VSKTNAVDATDGAAPEPPWLSVSESEAWMPLAGLIRKLPAALDKQLRSEAGISHFEYVVLSRLSHVVTRLEHRGWIRREPCPEDGRFTNAVLTDDGHAKVVATAPGHVQTVRAVVIDALSPTQLRQLRDIGKRILHQIDPDAAWPPPRERTTGRGGKRGT
jgi:hypothetical protein